MKFGRAYRLKITDEETGDEVLISNPITIQFTVSRHTSNALNELRADVYNLSENVRTFLFQEPWVDRKKKVTFEGGYDTLSTLFVGTLWSGFSQREGSDIVTTIWVKSETFELNNTTIYETINSATTVGDVLRKLLGTYGEKLPIDVIGEYSDKLLRPVTLNGNVWDLARKYSDNSVYVDNGRIYALKANEAINGVVTTINNKSGLLATPRREINFLQVQTLFEPRIVMNQLLTIESDIQDVYSGEYKVLGIQHTGIISESVGGDLRTIIDLDLQGRGYRVIEDTRPQ